MKKRGNIFSEVEFNKPQTNTFDLTHERKLSAKFGELTPIMLMETVPGDKITVQGSAHIKLPPLIAPLMHRMNVYLHYFFVPNRIIFPLFPEFITGGEDGFDNTAWPYFTYLPLAYQPGDLPDHLGLPVDVDQIGPAPTQAQVSALPWLAYTKIYNDYYRDQNLIDPLYDEAVPGDNTSFMNGIDRALLHRAYEHDYFTSALPWTQKGAEAMLPLGSVAPLLYNTSDPVKAVIAGTSTPPTLSDNVQTSSNVGNIANIMDGDLSFDVTDSHVADLSSATASSINDLRRALRLQVWLERNARGGSRYNESIAIHFGVKSSDARLQRPEYIGGSKTPIKISEVLQTSGTPDDTSGVTPTPQANMAGHAVSIGGGKSYTYRCEEHGYIMGIMSVLPETAYQQGIPRHFTRQDKFDYYWPEFAHIGEQAILNQEINFLDNSGEQNDSIFGYTPRYAEYKYMNNTVHGEYKDTLDFWHLGRKFSQAQLLNQKFIECQPEDVSRIFAVQNPGTSQLWCQVLNKVYARRPMPVFGTPKTF